MDLIRIKAITKKEFIQIKRDPRSLGIAIAIPILLLILFGYALTLDVDNVPMVVWDQDKSGTSRDFILNFNNSPYFKIIGYFDNYNVLQEFINKNKALMALVIPKDFSQHIKSNQQASVQLLVDGSDSNTATIAIGYVNAVTLGYNKKLIVDSLSKLGLREVSQIEMRPRIWFNPDLKSRNYIIPGLIAIIMMVISALLTSIAFAREWERGTMEQLISTPVKSRELIIGKFFPYFAIGFIDVVIAVAMGQFVFHVPFRGSVVLLFSLSCFFLAGALCQGMLISVIAKNQFLASMIAFISTFLPSFLLSGFAFAITNMPKFIQIITHIIPSRYFVMILKGIYLKGIGLKVLYMQVLFLFVFSIITVTLANMKFKKKVA